MIYEFYNELPSASELCKGSREEVERTIAEAEQGFPAKTLDGANLIITAQALAIAGLEGKLGAATEFIDWLKAKMAPHRTVGSEGTPPVQDPKDEEESDEEKPLIKKEEDEG